MAGTTVQRKVTSVVGESTHSTSRSLNLAIDDLETLRAATAGVLVGSATYDPPSLATGAQQTTTVTVTGAALGDFVQVSFSLDLAGTTMLGHVSAANTVTVVHRNGTAGTVDLASGTLRARVTPQATSGPVAAAALTAYKVANENGTLI